MARFREASCPVYADSSNKIVRGPTFTLSTSMCARNFPVATVAPRSRSAWAKTSTSGSAISAGAAAAQVGQIFDGFLRHERLFVHGERIQFLA